MTFHFFFLPLPIAAAQVNAEAPFGAPGTAGCAGAEGAGAMGAPGTNPPNPKVRAPNPRVHTLTPEGLPNPISRKPGRLGSPSFTPPGLFSLLQLRNSFWGLSVFTCRAPLPPADPAGTARPAPAGNLGRAKPKRGCVAWGCPSPSLLRGRVYYRRHSTGGGTS